MRRPIIERLRQCPHYNDGIMVRGAAQLTFATKSANWMKLEQLVMGPFTDE
jgi:hypothetical protein